MPVPFNLEVPAPCYVASDEEAYDVLNLLLQKIKLYPKEPLGFDTETHGLKIPIKGESADNPAPSDPLDWMNDTITFWSLSARMDRDMADNWVAYLRKYHPENLVDGDGNPMPIDAYGRWCLQQQHFHMFVSILENPEAILAGWNVKYDAHIAWNCGIDIWNAQVWDMMIAGYLLDENLQGRMGLKERALDWCKIQMTKYIDLFDTDEDGNKAKEFKTSLFKLPRDRVADYSSDDAYATLKLAEYLHKRLSYIGGDPEKKEWEPCELSPGYTLWDYFLEVEVPCTKVLWRMERRGLLVDTSRLRDLAPMVKKEIDEAEFKINKLTGKVINIQSPKVLVDLFFGENGKYTPVKMTKGGERGNQPSVDEEVLTSLAEEHGDEVAELILRSRKLHKIYGTYVSSMQKMTTHFNDHRIHPSFNQYGARTGRFSTQNPNSQNWPRPDNDEFGLRSLFVSPNDNALLVGDYEQLEMRIMAHMCQDKKMVTAILEGLDLHCYTVSVMYPGVTYDEVKAAKDSKEPDDRQKYLKSLRQAAKAIGFGLIYGAGPPRIASQLDISEDEAADKMDDYFKAFPGVKQFMENTVATCKSGTQYVQTLLGRRRRLRDIGSKNKILRGHAERESINAPIQGSAQDITKMAMLQIEFDKELNLMGLRLVNQIHDELVMEIPKENAEKALVKVKFHMENPLDGRPPLIVPTPADVKIVTNWAAAK